MLGYSQAEDGTHTSGEACTPDRCALPAHLLQAELLDACLVGGDGRALDAHVVLLRADTHTRLGATPRAAQKDAGKATDQHPSAARKGPSAP